MKRISLALILTAIPVMAASIAHAQRGTAPLLPGQTLQAPGTPSPQPPIVITGADLGFRVIRMEGNRAVGELVIRQNVPAGGTMWVPVDLGDGRGAVHPLTLQ